MFKEISSVVLYEVKEKAQVQPGGLHSRGGEGKPFLEGSGCMDQKGSLEGPGRLRISVHVKKIRLKTKKQKLKKTHEDTIQLFSLKITAQTSNIRGKKKQKTQQSGL